MGMVTSVGFLVDWGGGGGIVVVVVVVVVMWGIQIGGVAALKLGGGNSGCRGVVEGGESLC